jgi:hypothetical protein
MAAIISGSRLPKRDLMLSDHDPIAGSTIASKKQPDRERRAHQRPDRPRTAE